MGRKAIIAVLVLLGLAIAGIILADFLGRGAGNRGSNPYYLNLDEYNEVDPEQILYREIRQIDLGSLVPAGIDFYDGNLWMAANGTMLKISPEGGELLKTSIDDHPTCIHACSSGIFVGFQGYILSFDPGGVAVSRFTVPGDSSRITSLVVMNGSLFAADAGQRKVHRFLMNGEWVSSFSGKRNQDDLHGFIIPSGFMDLALLGDDELWVANTGMHALENYTAEGDLRGYWEKTSITIEGFCGCCNPSHFDIFDDGTFVTSEKGIFRIKVYRPSGEFIGVVAEPDRFKGATRPAEVAAGDDGRVYALDFDRKMIRVFEKKERS